MSTLGSEKKKGGDEIDAEMSGGGGNLLGVPWILEPRSPIRVPLYHACPIQHSLHKTQTGQGHTTPRTRMKRGASELTLATTANTMGPKTILMSISMLVMSLDDQLRIVRERCSLASGSVAEADTRGKGGSERDLESGTGIRGGEYEDLLPRYTSWDHYHTESITYRPPVWEAGDEGN